MPAWSDSEVVRLLVMSSPPASPLSHWSSPPPQIPFPPLPPILSPPSPKRLGIALGPRYEREVGYGITDSWDEIVETLQGAPVSTDTKLGRYMREFETRVRKDTDEIYMRLDDEQTERQLLAGRLNMLFKDRCAHAYTRHLMETEARMSQEAWVRSTDASDLVRGEVMSLRTTVLGQMIEIRELHAADRRRQTVILELLRTYHRRSTKIIELRTALQGQPTKYYGFYPGYIYFTMKCDLALFIRKLEIELWDLKVKGTDLASYTQRYQKLALLCGRMFSEESDKIEKYIRGLPDMIHGSVVAS
nr:reverse transcriptase domain-containing protein [Tanacetum cinerariifolium]